MSIAYRALALQTTCRAVNGCPGAAEAAVLVADNIARVGGQIRASKAFIGQDLKLVVLPEYFATSPFVFLPGVVMVTFISPLPVALMVAPVRFRLHCATPTAAGLRT